jgi:hypothetical protein
MKVVFDSNVWQIVVIPEEFLDEPFIEDFKKIRQAIIDKKIIPFLSETIFTIEAIRKVERQDFFSSQKPKIDFDVKSTEDTVSLGITIRPNEKDAIHFSDRPILEKYFNEAIKLDFNIVRLPRIAGFVNKEVEKVRYKQEEKALPKYLDKVFEVIRKIEDKGAGITQLKIIGQQYGDPNWMKGLKNAPESERSKIAKAAAEWADGDSVAISIALDCDYFCTRDRAKGAGSKSVLSETNLQWLYADYGFKTILPEILSQNL